MELGLEHELLSLAQELEPALTTHPKTQEEVFQELPQALELQITEVQALDPPRLKFQHKVVLQEEASVPL